MGDELQGHKRNEIFAMKDFPKRQSKAESDLLIMVIAGLALALIIVLVVVKLDREVTGKERRRCIMGTEDAKKVRHALLDDCRNIVSRSDVEDSKKTVAMNCIRSLEEKADHVAAILPMLLEVYFAPSIESAIRHHAERCSRQDNAAGFRIAGLKMLAQLPWSATVAIIALNIKTICDAVSQVLDKMN